MPKAIYGISRYSVCAVADVACVELTPADYQPSSRKRRHGAGKQFRNRIPEGGSGTAFVTRFPEAIDIKGVVTFLGTCNNLSLTWNGAAGAGPGEGKIQACRKGQ
jgi:hypothetical protein